MLTLVRDGAKSINIYYFVEKYPCGDTFFGFGYSHDNYISLLRLEYLAKEIKHNQTSETAIFINGLPPRTPDKDDKIKRRPLNPDEYIELHKLLGRNIELKLI